jgi:hypothetical protein
VQFLATETNERITGKCLWRGGLQLHLRLMGELIFKLLMGLLQALLELVCFYTARFLLPVISFGKLAVQPPRHPPAYGQSRPIVVPQMLAAVFGMVFWAIVIIVAVGLLRAPAQ